MSCRPLPRVFSLLGVEKDPAVDEALRESLPHLGEEAREAALKLICDRGRPATLAALIVSFKSFDPALQDAIAHRFDDFHPGLRAAIGSEKFEVRAAAISAVVAVKDYKSVHTVADALRSQCSRTRELAVDAIRRLTEAHIARRDRGISPSEAGDFHLCGQRLGEVLKSVIKNWEAHVHIGVLEAALWMIDAVEGALVEKMSQASNRISHAIRSILEETSDPRLAEFVVRALSHAELRTAAAKTISRSSDPKFIAALVDEMWLLTDVLVEQGFRNVTDTSGVERWLAAGRSLKQETEDAAMRLIRCRGGPHDEAISRLSAIAEQGSDQTRRTMLWQLVMDESPQSTRALGVIASRANDPRSAVAIRECNRRLRRESAPADHKVAEASSSLAGQALDRFIEEHDRLSPEDRSSLVEQFRSLGPELGKQLERKLDNPSGGNRAGTIRAIRTLGLLSSFLPRIYRFAHDSDPAIRAAALAVLDEDNSATAMRLLRGALNDPDPRVQATAIELLERKGVEKAVQPLREKFDSRDNRVRANAIKALWKAEVQNASQELEKMLNDNSAAHRLSALWVVERLKVRQIVQRLTTMSASDSDPRVRARATRVLGGLGIRKEMV